MGRGAGERSLSPDLEATGTMEVWGQVKSCCTARSGCCVPKTVKNPWKHLEKVSLPIANGDK